jgi:hypothetical protein
MSSMGTPQVQRPAGPPPVGVRSNAPGRPSPALWIAVFVAFVVGGVAGYLLGWDHGPAETKTVTRTATRTVAPPAYATGEFGATVTFDGGVCMYNGPAEQPARTMVDLNFRGVRGSSLILWRVGSGTTYQDFTYEEVVKFSYMFGAGGYLDRGPFVSSPRGAPHQELNRRLGEGLWLVGCTNHPDSGRQVFTATMLRVVPR